MGDALPRSPKPTFVLADATVNKRDQYGNAALLRTDIWGSALAPKPQENSFLSPGFHLPRRARRNSTIKTRFGKHRPQLFEKEQTPGA